MPTKMRFNMQIIQCCNTKKINGWDCSKANKKGLKPVKKELPQLKN